MLQFFKVIHQILRSHGMYNPRFWPEFSQRFRIVTQVWFDRWLWNDTQSLKYEKDVANCFSRSSVKFQGHMRHKIADFEPNWVFPNYSSNLNWPIATKAWSSIEDVPYSLSMSSVKFETHMGQKKSAIWPKLSISGL